MADNSLKRVLPRDKPAVVEQRKRRAGADDGAEDRPAGAGAGAEDAAEDGLVFEDPFGDEYAEDEDESSYDEDEEDDDEEEGGDGEDVGTAADADGENSRGAAAAPVRVKSRSAEMDEDYEDDDAEDGGAARKAKDVWRPGIDSLAEGEVLECDPEAYVMYHKMNVDWPCLSFDIVPDKLGMGRTKFPLSCTVVAGTQADSHGSNKLMVMRFSSLHRTQHDGRDSDSDVSDDDDEDDDAELEVERISHPGAVNRVRVMPQEPHIVAAWSETGKVNLFDVRPQLRLLDAHEGKGAAPPIPRGYGPVKTFSGHKSEGFALAWSGAAAGRLATGDCKGRIFVWEVDQAAAASAFTSSAGGAGASAAELGAVWQVNTDRAFTSHEDSVEDIQWSPNEGTVFASCGVDKTVRIWDTRAKSGHSMLHTTAHDTDVNVISWSPLVSFLLLSGADDGSFKIWDLRRFAPGGGSSAGAAEAPLPLANFRWHKGAITSLEWAYDDENVFVVSSEDNQVTMWDMSLEADEEAEMAMLAAAGKGAAAGAGKPAGVPSTRDPRLADIPPQLLFIHGGQEEVKEAHFHRQMPGVVLTTAADGFNIFKPDVQVTT